MAKSDKNSESPQESIGIILKPRGDCRLLCVNKQTDGTTKTRGQHFTREVMNPKASRQDRKQQTRKHLRNESSRRRKSAVHGKNAHQG